MNTQVILLWIGRVLTVLLSAMLIFSAIMKFVGGPDLEEGMAKFGLPMSIVVPLGIVELTCVILYLCPPTAMIGAILLTGYMGGAMLTHLRINDSIVIHIVLAILIWVALYLREPRLWKLMPIRTDLFPK
ncbi:DoxX family protein [Pirellula staleyi DSM 6068]|uniref:DoxX family protein n=1 Tax=Pirellula staleyi (strain ATCC 27377 / DSM 6068 / ICPB 4128) TaxID=530564 RepID=D2QXF0_PIRSD|nr:DoxX family protein [Pirellula staleyi]ADB16135.1 DoxX family protein [Pirellula staleyi DSM 6068]